MHDEAPSHTARATRALLLANRINVLPWPSLSPVLNPIEHIWDVIGQRVRSRVPLNIRDREIRSFQYNDAKHSGILFLRNRKKNQFVL